jgi:hypothetical protein
MFADVGKIVTDQVLLHGHGCLLDENSNTSPKHCCQCSWATRFDFFSKV